MRSFVLIFSLFVVAISAQARDLVYVGMFAGLPVYAPLPGREIALAGVYQDPAWASTPVETIMVDGIPHRLHYSNRNWFDEQSWGSRVQVGDLPKAIEKPIIRNPYNDYDQPKKKVKKQDLYYWNNHRDVIYSPWA